MAPLSPTPAPPRYTGLFRKGESGLKRRIFLTSAAALAGCGGPSPSWRFLTDAEAVTVDAITDRLIPADRDPGARAAGVVHFIDRQLKGKLKRDAAFFRTAIQALDASCRNTHKKPFAELPLDDQTAVLAALEKGQGSREFWPEGDDKRAFDMWLAQTMMGFYGSPRHGGNKDYASWKMLGLPPMPVRGRLHYEWKEQS